MDTANNQKIDDNAAASFLSEVFGPEATGAVVSLKEQTMNALARSWQCHEYPKSISDRHPGSRGIDRTFAPLFRPDVVKINLDSEVVYLLKQDLVRASHGVAAPRERQETDALRWWTLSALGCGVATGAFVACLIVGVIHTPVARRAKMPFAAVGFASAASMIPSSFLFRMGSGLLQLTDASHATLPLISSTLADGMIAVAIILAMSIGLIIPKLILDPLGD